MARTCPDCYDEEQGRAVIDPNCPTCWGRGTVDWRITNTRRKADENLKA